MTETDKSQITTILIADDDPDILDAVSLMLEDEGYNTRAIDNGEEVTQLAPPYPDLILLDIWMSGHDGGEICTLLKSKPETKHIPIIIFSANRDTELIAKKCGADDYVQKPFEIDDILAKIEKFVTKDQ